ncbi:non-heme iron oxygenase ferredoxin subunit [Fervidibacter sacchari]|jgi:Ferredoxin subunits of nitrite reductase and ring-hydroxylating dioxygenases|uniref:3-phenylpropionate/trans-cinnamate dioxygenase ferredoxin subunit n=1 Tax=Candidatus Fervidibacter sacchari TaxID=1448929 RepID=A0ABT2EPN2_9BACT|nr:non-heme iron oxygenase ferredoxin subunit [Candidatus Fervidibacter sacchari]MCS3919892.1 3-phenylpropionate/trans-cinnamate dioxygenase ferredoxin subunit [Candidatus Fervidibacter sacchari]WKU16870.1 non-heme iron oxygenase ferredoxin subunit [Candidatus Fervidibacter sacchari]
MGEWIKVGNKDEIPVNGAKVIVVEDTPIAVFRVGDNEFYAIEDTCTHDEASLSEGWFADQYVIECPRHGAWFDIRTGKALRMPAVYPVRTFAVKIEGDEVFVEWTPPEEAEESWGITERD